jgi:terminase, large subunit
MSRSPTETQRAVIDAVLRGLSPLRADAPESLSRWSAKNFRLSAESSHEQGKWHAYPFQKGWMDAFSNDDIEEVTVRKSKRVGYTKTLLAFIAYNAAHRRRKQAVWQPTDDDRDSFVKTEIDPMLRDVAAMRPVLLGAKDDTLKMKQFLGSVLHTLGGKAARAYRRITVAVAILDEASAFDLIVEKSIDPVEGARGRLEGAAFPKLVAGSTPRVKGIDHIETREANAEAVMSYRIECPHCQAEHPLQWGSEDVKFGFKGGGLGGDISPIRHHCPHCLEPISQGEYLKLYGDGAWVSACGNYRYGQDEIWRDGNGVVRRPPRHVAFHVWAAYSPQREWGDIAREFIQAKAKAKTGENGPLITFINETLGELWVEEFEKADEHALQRRAEPYKRFTVPAGGLELHAGIDTQDDRWEVVTWAFGRGEEMWCVDYSVIYGNPADDREWEEKLDPYLDKIFDHENGHTMKIKAVGVDTMGHFTHQAYNYCRTRERRRVYALRGDPLPSKMIKGKATIQDVNWRGRVLKRGVRLWYVGTNTAKDLLHARLKLTQPGPGYVHFSSDLPASFFPGLTAESRVKVRKARGFEFRWVNPPGRRNEPLDCTVYAMFCSHVMGLNTRTDAEWDRLAGALAADSAPAKADARQIDAPRAHEQPIAARKPLPTRPRQQISAGRQW